MTDPEPPPYPSGDNPEQPPITPGGYPPPPPPGGYPPAPPPPGVPPQYGMSAPGPLPGSGKATTSLVTGIIGILCCGLLGIVAVVTGKQATAEAAAAGFPQPGNAKAGIILGWIAIALMVLGLVVWIVVIAVGGMGAMMAPTDY
jgi:hypothetical protein